MPYEIVWESRKSFWARFSGTVTFAETENATNDYYADPRSDSVTDIFWDFSEIEGFDVTSDNVTVMAYTDRVASRYLPPVKAAFIVRDVALANLTDQYIRTLSTLGCLWENRRFEDMQSARDWVVSAS